MVAVVNRHVILESELDQATRVEFLMQTKPIDRLTYADRTAVLERLIDRSLLDQQIVNPTMLDPTTEELKAKVEEVRQGIPGGSANESWKTFLPATVWSSRMWKSSWHHSFGYLGLLTYGFAGLVRVDKEAIAAYYQERFLPEVRKRNASEPKLAEVSDKIEQILAEQRIDELLSNWLKTLRAQAHIERMLPATATNAGTP